MPVVDATIFNEIGVRLIPMRRKNMKPHDWADEYHLKRLRQSIETVNVQLEKMGMQCLHARTNPEFEIKSHASLFALVYSNVNWQSIYPL